MARYLGPADFGLLSFAISVATIFGAITIFGLDQLVVREIIISPDQTNEILGSAFFLKIFSTILLLPVLAIIINFMQSDKLITLLVLIICSREIFISLDVVQYLFRSKYREKPISIACIGQVIISSILKILFIIFNAPLIFIGATYVIDGLISALMNYFVFSFDGQRMLKWRIRVSRIRQFLKDGWPLIISTIAISIYLNIDHWMILEYLNSTQLGYYAVAVRICIASYVIPTAICTSLFPVIIKAKLTDGELFGHRLAKLSSLLTWIMVLFAIAVTATSQYLVIILFGEEYASSSTIVSVYVWAGIFVATGLVGNQWLLSKDLQRIAAVNTAIGAVLIIVLNMWLIPVFGVVGAAAAT